jgi:hypothetical protein
VFNDKKPFCFVKQSVERTRPIWRNPTKSGDERSSESSASNLLLIAFRRLAVCYRVLQHMLARRSFGRVLHVERALSTSASRSSPSPSTLKRGGRRTFGTFAAVTASLLTGYALALAYPPGIYAKLNPPPAPPSPSPDSDEGREATAKVEATLQGLPLVKELSRRVESEGWTKTRPYERLPDWRRAHSLLAGTLKGPGRIAVAPLVFSSPDDRESYLLVHVGRNLCGHE